MSNKRFNLEDFMTWEDLCVISIGRNLLFNKKKFYCLTSIACYWFEWWNFIFFTKIRTFISLFFWLQKEIHFYDLFMRKNACHRNKIMVVMFLFSPRTSLEHGNLSHNSMIQLIKSFCCCQKHTHTHT